MVSVTIVVIQLVEVDGSVDESGVYGNGSEQFR